MKKESILAAIMASAILLASCSVSEQGSSDNEKKGSANNTAQSTGDFKYGKILPLYLPILKQERSFSTTVPYR